MTDFKVDDRVQNTCSSVENIVGGYIVSLVLENLYHTSYRGEKLKDIFVSHIKVCWDNGKEEVLPHYDVCKEDTPLEREFRIKAAVVQAQIDEKMKVILKALDEAQAISDETGIPFVSEVSRLGQFYRCPSFKDKWAGVSMDVVESATEVVTSEDNFYGWKHSDC